MYLVWVKLMWAALVCNGSIVDDNIVNFLREVIIGMHPAIELSRAHTPRAACILV